MFNNARYVLQAVEPTNITEKKINSFEQLPEGWSFGEGVPCDNAIVNRAKGINTFAIKNGFLNTDAFPGLSGEVRVTMYSTGKYYEFTLEIDESITYAGEENGQEVSYEEGLTFDQALAKIKEVREQECRLSESFITINMTTDLSDSKALPLRIRVETEGFPSSQKIVQANMETASVSTLMDFMHKLRESPRYFGDSSQRILRTNTA